MKGCVRRNAVVKVVEEGVVWFCVWCMWGVLSRTTHLRLACVHNIHGYVTATSQLRHSYVTATTQIVTYLRFSRYDSPHLLYLSLHRTVHPECGATADGMFRGFPFVRRREEERRGAKRSEEACRVWLLYGVLRGVQCAMWCVLWCVLRVVLLTRPTTYFPLLLPILRPQVPFHAHRAGGGGGRFLFRAVLLEMYCHE